MGGLIAAIHPVIRKERGGSDSIFSEAGGVAVSTVAQQPMGRAVVLHRLALYLVGRHNDLEPRFMERTAKEFGIPHDLKPSLRAALASHVRRLRELGRPRLIPIPVRTWIPIGIQWVMIP